MLRRRLCRRPAALILLATAGLLAAGSSCGGTGSRAPLAQVDSDPRPSIPGADADPVPVDASSMDLPSGWRPAPLRWASCEDDPNDPDLSCATLVVPLDWSRPDGATIELAVARRAATGAAGDRIGTIVANPGGPGGSGVELIEDDPFSAGIARRFDRVGWDPRGVGDSTPVT
ncbi:MAG TPA: hypothetical protein PLX07_12460, partial [Microthrixaceae bacterium]|nr:hypothetical protein [Microthrixaceae bacterium]